MGPAVLKPLSLCKEKGNREQSRGKSHLEAEDLTIPNYFTGKETKAQRGVAPRPGPHALVHRAPEAEINAYPDILATTDWPKPRPLK